MILLCQRFDFFCVCKIHSSYHCGCRYFCLWMQFFFAAIFISPEKVASLYVLTYFHEKEWRSMSQFNFYSTIINKTNLDWFDINYLIYYLRVPLQIIINNLNIWTLTCHSLKCWCDFHRVSLPTILKAKFLLCSIIFSHIPYPIITLFPKASYDHLISFP